jgi:isopentenyl-diphosphate Delta-isomerase
LADELIDIYDENNKPLGIQKMKSEAHKNGLWHRASHVWIYNSIGQMLLQLRAKDKDTYPDKWDISAAGHAMAGETPEATALRELKEELGLVVGPDKLESVGTRQVSRDFDNGIKNREHQSIYLLKFDGDIGSLHAQEEEIQEIKFFDLKELEAQVRAHSSKFVAHRGDYWMDMIKLAEERSGVR